MVITIATTVLVSRRASGTEDEAREPQGASEDPAWRTRHRHPAPTASAPGNSPACLLLVALEQASSAPQTRKGGAGPAKTSFSGATGQPWQRCQAAQAHVPSPAFIRTELNRLSRDRRRNSLAIARTGRARTLAGSALISSEKVVRSPIPLTRGPGQRLRSVPSGGPRPATSIA